LDRLRRDTPAVLVGLINGGKVDRFGIQRIVTRHLLATRGRPSPRRKIRRQHDFASNLTPSTARSAGFSVAVRCAAYLVGRVILNLPNFGRHVSPSAATTKLRHAGCRCRTGHGLRSAQASPANRRICRPNLHRNPTMRSAGALPGDRRPSHRHGTLSTRVGSLEPRWSAIHHPPASLSHITFEKLDPTGKSSSPALLRRHRPPERLTRRGPRKRLTGWKAAGSRRQADRASCHFALGFERQEESVGPSQTPQPPVP
jgi:hypothetical protein